MDYNLLICTSSECWVAVDVNEYGTCDRVSLNGNESAKIDSTDKVKYFCEQIKDYYNIDTFCDLDMNIKIIVDEYSDLTATLFEYLKEAKSVNIIDLKNVVPIYILKNCTVKPNSSVDARCMNVEFKIKFDDKLRVSYSSVSSGEFVIINPEDFAFLFKFDCTNLISDERELCALREKYTEHLENVKRELEVQKAAYKELQEKYNTIEKYYMDLKRSIEERNHQINEKRAIVRFFKDRLERPKTTVKSWMGEIDDSMLDSFRVLHGRQRFKCRLFKSDGDIVKKGEKLLDVIEEYSTSTESTGRKCVINAPADGRIFLLVKENSYIKNSGAVAIITDPADNKNDALKWYEEMK